MDLTLSQALCFPIYMAQVGRTVSPVTFHFRTLTQKQSVLTCRFDHLNILSPGRFKQSDQMGASLKWGPSSEPQTQDMLWRRSPNPPGTADASPWPDAGRVLAAPTKGFRCESPTKPQQGSGTRKEVTTLKVTPSELKSPKEWNHRLVKLENVFISVTWLTRLPHILLRFWSCLHSVMSCNSKKNSYNFMRCWQHSEGTFPCDFHILQLFFNFTIIFSNASLYRKYVCWSGRPKREFSNKNILRHNKWKRLHQNTKTDSTI